MQRQRTQVSCGDMFALLNQNHGSEKIVLWSVSQCGRPIAQLKFAQFILVWSIRMWYCHIAKCMHSAQCG